MITARQVAWGVRSRCFFGEPGVRQLPRQTHQRILATFARGTLTVGEGN